MKPDSIVYTSATGHSAAYAKLLGEATGLPVYERKAAPAGGCILYLGWLMAGQVKGLSKAAKGRTVAAYCGVGMSGPGSQEETVAKAMPGVPSFYLQGGYEGKKLHGIYRFMMFMMEKGVGQKLERQETLTPEEAEMLEMMQHGGSRVSKEKLAPVLAWMEAQG